MATLRILIYSKIENKLLDNPIKKEKKEIIEFQTLKVGCLKASFQETKIYKAITRI